MALTTKSATIVLLLFTLLATAPQPSHSITLFTNYRILVSLAHSLTTRIANLRASRQDYAGAARAQAISQKLEHGLSLGFWKMMAKTGWHYMKNYSWRSTSFFSSESVDNVSDLKELIASLSEWTRLDSDAERILWVQRNYKNVLRASKTFFTRMLRVFGQPGPLREVVEILQKEVIEGELLRDCLELGSNDLKGLIQVLKDLALPFTSTNNDKTDL